MKEIYSNDFIGILGEANLLTHIRRKLQEYEDDSDEYREMIRAFDKYLALILRNAANDADSDAEEVMKR